MIRKVSRAVGRLIEESTKVAPPIRWINRWPAVMFAVSRTARAMGWIKRLIVSIITSMGIRGMGVPWGRKWAKEALGLWRKPKRTAPAHRGIAMPRFMDSWVVAVNVWGRRPRRFVDPIKIIRVRSIRDQERPFELWISIICFTIIRISHCCKVVTRLVIRRLGDGNRAVGKRMMRVTMGRPISEGVMKEANRFSFIWVLKSLGFWRHGGLWGLEGGNVEKMLIWVEVGWRGLW